MLIKTIVVGSIGTNCYIVTDPDTNECAVIDPGDESKRILNYIEDNKFKVRAILITHGHFDHTGAASDVSKHTNSKIYINKKDASSTDVTYKYYPGNNSIEYYSEGDTVEVGSLLFEVMETPGHSEGSVTLKCKNALFTGDALFRDSCGRTDLPGGNMEILQNSLLRLYNLDGDYEIYPGHMDSTTLQRERNYNYYMKYAAGNK